MRAVRDFLLAPRVAEVAAGGRPADRGRIIEAVSRPAIAPASVALLCAPADARALGVAAATLLARRHRTGCGLACVWTAPGHEFRRSGLRPPSSRAARRLAGALGARGIDATAFGRAVAVTLPADPAHAVAAAARAGAAAGTAPTVLVLGGARAAAFDARLADFDRILVLARTDADRPVATLAVAGLGPLAPRATAVTVTLGPAARGLAAAGLAVPPALRRALAGTVEDDV